MQRTYAYKNTMENLKISSSGGAFLGIAKAFFRLHPTGIVYGSMFDKDFHVVHSSARFYDECRKFSGSKYVQSSVGKCFIEIGNFLCENKYVLFSGVPCQIGGLLKYLDGKSIKREHLYTLDIVCHGTPSEDIWLDYVKHLENKENAKLEYFSFRYKPLGWKGYPIYAKFSNGVIKKNTIEISSYQNIYRKNLLTKRGCFNCPYPGAFQSDITICDFWGVELICPGFDTKGGVSLIISRGIRSDEIINFVKKEDGIEIREFNDVTYEKYNHNLIHKTEMPDGYDLFWQEYRDHGLNYVLRKYGGESFLGRIRFNCKRFIRNIGVLDLAKKILRKA